MKKKASQQDINDATSTIICEVINPLIYDDKVDSRELFSCLESIKFNMVFDTDYLLSIGHADGAIEELVAEIRESIRSENRL